MNYDALTDLYNLSWLLVSDKWTIEDNAVDGPVSAPGSILDRYVAFFDPEQFDATVDGFIYLPPCDRPINGEYPEYSAAEKVQLGWQAIMSYFGITAGVAYALFSPTTYLHLDTVGRKNLFLRQLYSLINRQDLLGLECASV